MQHLYTVCCHVTKLRGICIASRHMSLVECPSNRPKTQDLAGAEGKYPSLNCVNTFHLCLCETGEFLAVRNSQ